MYRSPSPGPSFAVRVYRSPSKAKAQTAIHSHGPSLAVRVYRSPGTSKFKNRALFAHRSTRSSPEIVQNRCTPDFCNCSGRRLATRGVKYVVFLNGEVLRLRYSRTARKGTFECIAIRGGRSGKPEGFSHRERSDCDTFARRGRVRSKRPHTFALFLSSMSRKSSTFALFWPRRARKNPRPSHFLGLDERKVVCMRS